MLSPEEWMVFLGLLVGLGGFSTLAASKRKLERRQAQAEARPSPPGEHP